MPEFLMGIRHIFQGEKDNLQFTQRNVATCLLFVVHQYYINLPSFEIFLSFADLFVCKDL